MAETVPGYVLSTWAGIGAPKNTPADIVSRLNEKTIAGWRGLPNSAIIRDDIANWAKAVK